MSNLIVVVDPDYADQVQRAAQFAPVGVVATQANRDACERLWRNTPHTDHREKGAVTCYKTLNPEDRPGESTRHCSSTRNAPRRSERRRTRLPEWLCP